jgi:hypothetical protein
MALSTWHKNQFHDSKQLNAPLLTCWACRQVYTGSGRQNAVRSDDIRLM